MSAADELLNVEVKDWSTASVDEIRMALVGIGAKKSGRLIRELKVRLAQQFGSVNRITFSFPRHLVWLEKGASKGYGGAKGSTWFTQGERRKTDPRSLGRMGTGARPARPTFNRIIDKRLPILLGIMQRHYADAGVKAILLR